MADPWVIVALPSNDEHVWKISSEKVPHMTMVYMAAAESAESAKLVADFVSHVASTLPRFGLNVSRRGLLGSEDADVLFFDEKFVEIQIASARSHLVNHDEINKLYNAVEQHPSWTPHLTLGYPDRPAKKDTREYPGIHWVNFDRLALWTSDFEGLVVPLAEPNMEVAMSDDQVDNFLAHYGVKGMKWGVRRKGGAQVTKGSSSSEASGKSAPKKTESNDGAKPVKGKDGRITAAPKTKPKASSREGVSDEELRAAINRINMERQYAQLTTKPTKADAAKKVVADILMDVGKQQAKAVLNGLAAKELQKRGIASPPKNK